MKQTLPKPYKLLILITLWVLALCCIVVIIHLDKPEIVERGEWDWTLPSKTSEEKPTTTTPITLGREEEIKCESCEECENRIITDCIYPVGRECLTFPIKVCRKYSDHIFYPCDEFIEEIEIEGIRFYKVKPHPVGPTDLIRVDQYTKKFYIEEMK